LSPVEAGVDNERAVVANDCLDETIERHRNAMRIAPEDILTRPAFEMPIAHNMDFVDRHES
jgi:hypothetical protein